MRRKPIEIGARVVRHRRGITFQMAEVAAPRDSLRKIPRLIDGPEHYPNKLNQFDGGKSVFRAGAA